MPSYILSIDPSTKRIGWALLRIPLEQECPFRLSAGWKFGSWVVRGEDITAKLGWIRQLICPPAGVSYVQLVAEMPMFFNNERGRIAAREGYLNNLCLVL